MYSPEELAFQKQFSFGQLLQNGITSALPVASLFYREWAETEDEFAAAADIAGEMGLRVWLGPAYRSGGMVCTGPNQLRPVFDQQRGLRGLEDAIRFIGQQAGRFDGLVQGMLAPDRVETCTQTLLQRTMETAEELNVPVRLHMAQGQMELDTVRQLHGSTAPEWLAGFGALSDRLIAPHATFATDHDLELYRDHGVTIAHCPLVFARSGAILRSLRKCLDMGIHVGMGTDTAPPDMILNMALAHMTARIADGDASAVSCADVFNLATIGGADALHRSDLGRLMTGAKADIAIFDLNQPAFAPTIDPIQSLVLSANGRSTMAVFVDGRLSMRHGDVSGIDMASARERIQDQFEGLIKKYPERTWAHPELSAIFPPSFAKF